MEFYDFWAGSATLHLDSSKLILEYAELKQTQINMPIEHIQLLIYIINLITFISLLLFLFMN